MRPFFQGVPHQEWLKIKQVETGSIKITVTTLATTATVLFTLSQFLDKIATIDLTRELKEAEIEKVKAETQKVKAETDKIKQEVRSLDIENKNSINSLVSYPENGSIMSINEEDHIAIAKYKKRINYDLLGGYLDSPNSTVDAYKENLLEVATDPLLNVYYKFGQLGYKIRLLDSTNMNENIHN